MRRSLILGGILLMAIPSIGFAQNQRMVKGFVMDENNRPLPEASVSVDGKNYTRVAEDGSFAINVSYMIPSITAYSEGYLPEEKKIDGSYLIFKLKVDVQAEKDRLAAEEKARKEADAKLKAEESAREKAEKDRLAAEEKARKEAKAKEKAEEAAREKAEKDRLAAEERVRKEAEAKVKAEEAVREKARKEAEANVKAEELARVKAEKKAIRQEKEDAYNSTFRNRGIEHSIAVSYAYTLDECRVEYVYSGYREYRTLHPFELDYTLSYRFNRFVSVGVGVGFLFNAKSISIVNDSFSSRYGDFKEHRMDVPVFASVRFTPLRTRIRPFISGSVGYYVLSGTIMGEGDLGADIRLGRRSSIQVGLMVRTTPYPFLSVAKEAGYYPCLSPGVKLGMVF